MLNLTADPPQAVEGINFSNTLANNTLLTTRLMTTVTTPKLKAEEQHSSSVLVYILVPIGSLAFMALVAFVIVMVFRKNRLDRLRHHLMPLYSFDPAEEEGDWESELLDEEKEQQVALRAGSNSPSYSPKLKFSPHRLDI
ncbi:hypothetical protein ScPMuIL_007555 [Solemya velum]